MDSAPTSVDATTFRRLMSRWATGVSIVTARDGGADLGLTVNSFVSVALTPPLLLVSLTQEADTTPAIRASRSFAVSVLAADQQALSERFARTDSPEEKFRGLALERTPGGLAVVPDSLGWFECRVYSEVGIADHLLIVGEVVAARAGRDGLPLLFFRGSYAEGRSERGLELPPYRE